MEDIICDLKVFFGIDNAEEELTSVEFFRLVSKLHLYDGALRKQLEFYAEEHKEEIEAERKQMHKSPALDLSPDQLKSNPKLGAAPGAGQAAPLFDVGQVQ